jgi:hypothetical protein
MQNLDVQDVIGVLSQFTRLPPFVCPPSTRPEHLQNLSHLHGMAARQFWALTSWIQDLVVLGRCPARKIAIASCAECCLPDVRSAEHARAAMAFKDHLVLHATGVGGEVVVPHQSTLALAVLASAYRAARILLLATSADRGET